MLEKKKPPLFPWNRGGNLTREGEPTTDSSLGLFLEEEGKRKKGTLFKTKKILIAASSNNTGGEKKEERVVCLEKREKSSPR